jgi:superfamily II DNA or RNA helicase
MTPSATLLPDNRTWTLNVTEDQIPNLAIPGLKALAIDGKPQVRGYIDAVAAACRVVGVEPPAMPSPPQFQIEGISLRDYQVRGVEMLHQIQREASGALLADEMGCIDGEAEIITYRKGATRRRTLASLYKSFKKLPDNEWKCRSLNEEEGIFQQRRILDVLYKGEKPCLEITLEDGKRLVCTSDHEILTTNSWVPAGELTRSSVVFCNGYNIGTQNANWKGGRKFDKDGYVLLWMPSHPDASQNYVREHRLVMEKHLGRRLRKGEIVHHKNHKRDDNRLSNLELTTKSGHSHHHPEKYRHLDGGRTINGGEVIILPRPVRVKSVRPLGIRPVYDIKMEGPHHNFVANRMVVHNCGKSRQSITLAKLRQSKRVVIVCPGRARYTWVEELEKAGETAYALMLPKGAKGWKAHREKVATARWVITSYNLLDEIPRTVATSMLMVDEAHEVKSQGAQRSQAVLGIARMVPYRLLISATPAWNVPKDWWFLLELAFPGRFGRKHDFEARYADGHQGQYGWVAKGVSHADELRTRLAYYMVRREKRDVAQEMPPMTDVPLWLDANPQATAAMRASALKVPGCSFYDALLATLEAKMSACVELAHSAKRFLLFTWQKAHAGIMARQLNDEGTPCVLLHGDMSDAQRRDAIALARTKQIGIVATIDSAGQSLNLQGIASQGIMHYQDPVPFKMMQARSRLHRLGITEPVTWTHPLMKDSADEVVWRRSTSKLMAQEASMPAMQEAAEYREAMNANSLTDEEALAAMYAEMSEMGVEGAA